MNRRDLLKYAGTAGLLAGLPKLARRAVAGPSAPPRRLLIVMASGGWDTTYALDPKAQSDKVDVPAGVIRRFGALEVFDDPSRPNVTAFFDKHAATTAIIRGI